MTSTPTPTLTATTAADYDKETRTVNLLAHTNSNTVTLREGVATGAFTFDEAGEIMVYAVDVISKPVNSGNVECVSELIRYLSHNQTSENYMDQFHLEL